MRDFVAIDIWDHPIKTAVGTEQRLMCVRVLGRVDQLQDVASKLRAVDQQADFDVEVLRTLVEVKRAYEDHAAVDDCARGVDAQHDVAGNGGQR